MSEAVLETNIPGWVCRRGKVRDVYDLGERLLIVASDRISAFDCILPTGIPGKGKLLTALSRFWFDYLKEPNHLVSFDLAALAAGGTPLPAGYDPGPLVGRSMIVHKAQVAPVECVVRGYLVGSGWKEYQKTQSVCGLPLPAGLQDGSKLSEPIFTPTTKADVGHDEAISFEAMAGIVGADVAEELRRRSVAVYQRGAEWAASRGVIIADTKFEWGFREGKWILVDEVLTPDSSRFWPADRWQPGRSQPSFDKQYVRDWLETCDWDKTPPPPALPPEVAEGTRDRYLEAFERITGRPFEG